ncbi:mucin-2 protein [Nocardioides pantholopis]|uniref:mucin-2 protein n=1 Tax=Nocardioides pantholopis TaxID=2483798 RepID=UPI000F095C61|nr:mucin-2 protein [Nocardioides pantholopis]
MAEHRHKRETPARRIPRAVVIAGPLAVMATASVVTLGVALGDPATSPAPSAAPVSSETSPSAAARGTSDVASKALKVVSRSGSRFKIKPISKAEKLIAPAEVRQAVRSADTKLWATETLNLWPAPDAEADPAGELEAGERVLVTGRTFGEREEVVVDGAARWVTAGYLAAEKPEKESVEEVAAECTNGTSVPSGVSPNIAKVHEAVCAAFPEISTYGTFRSDGEHGQGLAVDIMVSGERGWEVAEFVRDRYADLGVSYLIYAQKIWSVERSGEGWRGMSDRGSTTANHYDHVHVTTY